jgi:VIT1/CCC1 family predicted Fe2+/Mn2+ transporter
VIKENLRTIIFGIEDSFVSTTGVVVGLIAAGTSTSTVITAGLITIVVEATSMGAGEFISNDENEKKDKVAIKKGVLMLLSYLLAGFWIMIPLFIGITNNVAIVAFTLTNLFGLGVWRGAKLKASKLKYGLRTLLVGGVACGLGVTLGLALR